MPLAPAEYALRLLALVLTALFRDGWQRVAHPQIEGGTVAITLACNPKLRRDVDRLATLVSMSLSHVGLVAQRDGLRCLVLVVSEPSPEALRAVPSVEAMAALLQGRLRERMAAAGCHEAERMCVVGVSTDGGGAIYVTGGYDADDNAPNARAATWCRAWLAKHFHEMRVEGGRDPVSKLAVWRESGRVRRALRLTVVGMTGAVAA